MESGEMASPVFERVVAPSRRHPTSERSSEADHRLNVAVVFTSTPATMAAIRKAGALAEQLRARVTLLVPQIVPYPLPLETPPVMLDFSEQHFREIAAACPVETTVRIYLCRDPFETLPAVLAPGAPVVIGGAGRWWPTREKSLARHLRRAGLEVIFTPTE